jgi:hypothetical protein
VVNLISLPYHLFKFIVIYKRFWIFLRTFAMGSLIITLELILGDPCSDVLEGKALAA